MTKEEISAMQAGEELDKLVAEALGDVFETTGYDKCYRHFQKNPAYGGWSIPAPTSTDISAAWQVVEKLYQDHFCMKLEVIPDDDDQVAYYCCFYPSQIGGAEKMTLTLGHSMPEAICKAALLTKYSIKNVKERMDEKD